MVLEQVGTNDQSGNDKIPEGKGFCEFNGHILFSEEN